MKISGKYVLITGAAKRIGKQTVLTLAHAGAKILIHYRKSSKDAKSLQNTLKRLGHESWLVQADFSHRSQMEPVLKKFVKQVYSLVPRVDVLINNASIFYPTELDSLKEKDWDAFMSTNLKAPFFLSKIIGAKMVKSGGGKIIQMVDWTAEKPAVRFLPYAISKAGLVAATKGLAKAFAPKVQVLGIAPGPILPAAYATPQEQKKVAERSLLKRYGHPSDIAETIKFLIEGTDFMTGTIVTVDGGASLV